MGIAAPLDETLGQTEEAPLFETASQEEGPDKQGRREFLCPKSFAMFFSLGAIPANTCEHCCAQFHWE